VWVQVIDYWLLGDLLGKDRQKAGMLKRHFQAD